MRTSLDELAKRRDEMYRKTLKVVEDVFKIIEDAFSFELNEEPDEIFEELNRYLPDYAITVNVCEDPGEPFTIYVYIETNVYESDDDLSRPIDDRFAFTVEFDSGNDKWEITENDFEHSQDSENDHTKILKCQQKLEDLFKRLNTPDINFVLNPVHIARYEPDLNSDNALDIMADIINNAESYYRDGYNSDVVGFHVAGNTDVIDAIFGPHMEWNALHGKQTFFVVKGYSVSTSIVSLTNSFPSDRLIVSVTPKEKAPHMQIYLHLKKEDNNED